MSTNNYMIVDGQLYNTDELYHHGVKGMKWGVRKKRYDYAARTVRGHAGLGRYITKKRQEAGDKRDLERLNKGQHLSVGLTKKRQAAYDARDKAAIEKRQLKSDVKEYRKLRDEFSKGLNKSIRKKAMNSDNDKNLNNLSKVKDFVDSKTTQKGREYTNRMLDMADKKGAGVAASVGLAWIESKFG